MREGTWTRSPLKPPLRCEARGTWKAIRKSVLLTGLDPLPGTSHIQPRPKPGRRPASGTKSRSPRFDASSAILLPEYQRTRQLGHAGRVMVPRVQAMDFFRGRLAKTLPKGGIGQQTVAGCDHRIQLAMRVEEARLAVPHDLCNLSKRRRDHRDPTGHVFDKLK